MESLIRRGKGQNVHFPQDGKKFKVLAINNMQNNQKDIYQKSEKL